MVVLDVTIVNVALPDIQADLDFSADDLQWVVSAYTLRSAASCCSAAGSRDLLGRRRDLLAGLGLFTVASLAGGLATSPGVLIGVRAVQGFGGALLSPAALSILTVTFAHGPRAQHRAGHLGRRSPGSAAPSASSPAASSSTRSAGSGSSSSTCRSAIAPARADTARSCPRAASTAAGPRTFDVAGAVLGTAGVLALVFGVIRAEPLGWGSSEVIGLLAAGVALLAAFVAVESRSRRPARAAAAVPVRAA